MADDIIEKAKRLEAELMASIEHAFRYGDQEVPTELLERAAELIHRMRVRLQGENSTDHGGDNG